MKKEEFIELVTIQLTGGTPGTKSIDKYHPEVIERQIGLVFNELVSTIQDIQVLDQFCIVRKNVPVLLDEDFDIKYCEIPEVILSTRAGVPIRHVSPMKDQSDVFLHRPNHSQAAYRNLDTQYVFAENVFRIEGKRLYFDIIRPDIEVLLIKLIAAWDDIDDDDNIIMPGGQDSTAFRLVLEQIREQKQTPVQYQADNNANTN